MMRDPYPVDRPLSLMLVVQRKLSIPSSLHEVVACVANNQAKVALSCEVNASLDLLSRPSKNHVLSVKAACAWCSRIVCWQACVVGVERPEIGNRVVGPPVEISLMLTYSLFWDSQPLLVAPIGLCVGAFRCVVNAGFVLELFVADSTWW